MALHNDIGKKGEQIAYDYLKDNGYRIIEQNYRYRRSEVDIIAFDQEALVFIEVKSRSSNFFGEPESFITARKKELIADAASFYMEDINHEWEVRFDYISILFKENQKHTLHHFKDAFFPGW